MNADVTQDFQTKPRLFQMRTRLARAQVGVVTREGFFKLLRDRDEDLSGYFVEYPPVTCEALGGKSFCGESEDFKGSRFDNRARGRAVPDDTKESWIQSIPLPWYVEASYFGYHDGFLDGDLWDGFRERSK